MQAAAREGANEVRGEVVEIEARVRICLRGRLCDFRLVRCDQGVVLLGRAPSYYVKQLAQHAVMRASAIPILANRIAVP